MPHLRIYQFQQQWKWWSVGLHGGWWSKQCSHSFRWGNIDLTIVYSRKHRLSFNRLKVTSPAPTPDPQTTAAVHRVKLKELKLRSWSEVKILPFTNRKQIGINSIAFIPIAELSSSVTHNQELLTLWAAGWVIKAQDLTSHIQLEWLDDEYPCR